MTPTLVLWEDEEELPLATGISVVGPLKPDARVPGRRLAGTTGGVIYGKDGKPVERCLVIILHPRID